MVDMPFDSSGPGPGPGPSSPRPLLSLRWADRAEALDSPPALARLRLTNAPLSRVPPSAAISKSRNWPSTWPSDAQANPNLVAITLSPSDFVLSGRVWTAFRTACAALAAERIVVKLHVPAPADYGALEEAAIEGWVYECRLATLDIVPAWYGMYAAGRRGKGPLRVLVAALEDAGEPMGTDEVERLTPSER